MRLKCFVWPYARKYYILRPWKWIRQLWYNCKDFWYRGKYGFSPSDAHNIVNWAPSVLANAMRYMAFHNKDWTPVSYKSHEQWYRHVCEIANKLDRCGYFLGGNSELTDERNEYTKAFEEMCERVQYTYKDEKGNTVFTSNYTPEDIEVRDKYWARQEELHETDRKYAREVFGYFGENLEQWWW